MNNKIKNDFIKKFYLLLSHLKTWKSVHSLNQPMQEMSSFLHNISILNTSQLSIGFLFLFEKVMQISSGKILTRITSIAFKIQE